DPALLAALGEQQAAGVQRIDAEAAVLGIDHAELGGLIARSWALPDTLVQGIRDHGRPRPGSGKTVHAVHVAAALAKAVGAGPDENSDGALAGALEELGLTATDFAELAVLVGERLDEVEHRFD